MNTGSNGVARPVDEVLAITSGVDVIASSAVYFPAGNRFACGDGGLHFFHSSIAPATCNLKNLPLPVRGCPANKSGPSDVVIDSTGFILLSPNVQQNEVTLSNRDRVLRVRLIMRITAVAIDRDNGRIVC